jgi:hypothetical protein
MKSLLYSRSNKECVACECTICPQCSWETGFPDGKMLSKLVYLKVQYTFGIHLENGNKREIMETLLEGDTEMRVTKVIYIFFAKR